MAGTGQDSEYQDLGVQSAASPADQPAELQQAGESSQRPETAQLQEAGDIRRQPESNQPEAGKPTRAQKRQEFKKNKKNGGRTSEELGDEELAEELHPAQRSNDMTVALRAALQTFVHYMPTLRPRQPEHHVLTPSAVPFLDGQASENQHESSWPIDRDYQPPALDVHDNKWREQCVNVLNQETAERKKEMSEMTSKHEKDMTDMWNKMFLFSIVCGIFIVGLLYSTMTLSSTIHNHGDTIGGQSNQIENLKDTLATKHDVNSIESQVSNLHAEAEKIVEQETTIHDINNQIKAMQLDLQKLKDYRALDNHIAESKHITDWVHNAESSLRTASNNAHQALQLAQETSSRVKGVCFVKSKSEPCPANASSVVLWHWYYPDSYDPWCGGRDTGYEDTSDEAAGECSEDSNGHFRGRLFGCCHL
jgi:hypothetical protein